MTEIVLNSMSSDGPYPTLRNLTLGEDAYWMYNFPMAPPVRLSGWLVGPPVNLSKFPKRYGKFLLRAPIGALVFT